MSGDIKSADILWALNYLNEVISECNNDNPNTNQIKQDAIKARNILIFGSEDRK